jgi:hypothetical protein
MVEWPHPNSIYGVLQSTGTNASAYIGSNSASLAKGTTGDLVAFSSSLSGSGKVEFVKQYDNRLQFGRREWWLLRLLQFFTTKHPEDYR